MKKFLLYTFLGAASLMASCTEDFNEDVAAPQQWEQEAAITLPSLNITPSATINLAEAGDSVSLFTATLSGELPEGATLGNFRVRLHDVNVNTILQTTADGIVASEDLQTIIETSYGKRPTERLFKAFIDANVVINGQASLLSESTTITAIPKAPHIASAYYMVGDMFAWDAAGMAKFNHSDKDVYEDPYFSITFTTAKDNQYWKIIPQEHVDEGNIWGANVVGTAVDGDASLEGTLVNTNAQAGKIEKAGMYKMTINMMDYTYKISPLAPEYFILGDTPFGWNVNDKKFMMYPQSATLHSYTTLFNGNIKMINSNDMGSDNWGACYGTPTDGDTSVSASLQQNAGAIHVPEAGYYTLTVDFDGMSYTWTKCENQEPTVYTSISLIGDFNGWGGDADLEQIAPHNWFIGNFEVGSAGGIKFRANHDWPINWGATLNVGDVNYGVGVGNGDNISVPAGTYNVFFNDITGDFVFQAI